MGIPSPSHQGALYLKHFWYREAHFHIVKCSISLLSVHAARNMIVLISLSYLITYPISSPLSLMLCSSCSSSQPPMDTQPIFALCANGRSCRDMLGDAAPNTFQTVPFVCCCQCLIAAIVARLWASLLLWEIRQRLCFMKTLHKLTSSEQDGPPTLSWHNAVWRGKSLHSLLDLCVCFFQINHSPES